MLLRSLLTQDFLCLDPATNLLKSLAFKVGERSFILRMLMKVDFYVEKRIQSTLLGAVTAIVISADGRTIISASEDKSIRAFDMNDQEKFKPWKNAHGGIKSSQSLKLILFIRGSHLPWY